MVRRLALGQKRRTRGRPSGGMRVREVGCITPMTPFVLWFIVRLDFFLFDSIEDGVGAPLPSVVTEMNYGFNDLLAPLDPFLSVCIRMLFVFRYRVDEFSSLRARRCTGTRMLCCC
jgi:hypothetical protein